MYFHRHTIRAERSLRWWVNIGSFELRGEFSRRWRSGFILTAGYGGQEDFAEATFAISRLFFAHLAFDTPSKWHRIRPFDGRYGQSEREFGLRAVRGTLYLLVGHDAMGTYYGTGKRWWQRWFNDIRRNQQVTLFRGDWVLGMPRHSLEVLESGIPVTVNVGQWPGDSYTGTATHTRRTWKRRFSTKVSDGYEIEMQQGIPFPGKGENSWDCGDDAYFGFGGPTIESATERIIADVKRRRGGEAHA